MERRIDINSEYRGIAAETRGLGGGGKSRRLLPKRLRKEVLD